ncbi:SUKH-4 family immunity protein [Polycladomyces sp. WAk]|uniref:SUKH-4 family immunity protein n=1 Tax=Polycladomyces zharkentensis TaxID=2807616 RepID=A0ABS2WNB4_9BACL|nr:SUKH-4 family immunity protein [Polycladomyces sp. WAk]MBN2911011.1 SUKH-4 family immunity protein [Polycladomyces sp. WAk]
MNDLHKEISGYWDKDDLVTISRELLDPFDLAYDTKIVLSSIGLPMNVEEVKEHPFYINFYHEPEMGLYCGDDYIIIGDNESSKIGIHKKTGNIHLIEETPAACVQIRFINSDIAKFLMFLKVYLSYRPQLVDAMGEDDEKKLFAIVDHIKQRMNQMDSKALLDAESYWSVILEQVEDGLSC